MLNQKEIPNRINIHYQNFTPGRPPGCDSDDDCPDHLYCINRRCENPCEAKICGVNAYCNATNHQAICRCPPNYYGNPETECSTYLK